MWESRGGDLIGTVFVLYVAVSPGGGIFSEDKTTIVFTVSI